MTQFNMKDFNKPNECFIVSGRIIPTFENNVWKYTEEVFSKPYIKKYEDDEIDNSYIQEEGKVVFFITLKTTALVGLRFVLIGMDMH
jgi:hypothetical protein